MIVGVEVVGHGQTWDMSAGKATEGPCWENGAALHRNWEDCGKGRMWETDRSSSVLDMPNWKWP